MGIDRGAVDGPHLASQAAPDLRGCLVEHLGAAIHGHVDDALTARDIGDDVDMGRHALVCVVQSNTQAWTYYYSARALPGITPQIFSASLREHSATWFMFLAAVFSEIHGIGGQPCPITGCFLRPIT